MTDLTRCKTTKCGYMANDMTLVKMNTNEKMILTSIVEEDKHKSCNGSSLTMSYYFVFNILIH